MYEGVRVYRDRGVALRTEMKCCGDKEYDPTSEACCPNGNQIISGVTDHFVGIWCADCAYIENGTEYFHCCDSNAGTAKRKETIACICFDCIKSDCLDMGLADLIEACLTLNGKDFFCNHMDLIRDATIRHIICESRQCPDFDCG